jgi:hypothetical protein
MPPLRDRDAATVLGPLEESYRTLREGLDARINGFHSDLSGYWSTMRALLHASEQTMRAVAFLVADKRIEEKEQGKGPGPFPAQAIMLQRSLVETLANVLALSDDRSRRTQRDRLFRRDGYKESAKEHMALLAKRASGKLIQRKNARWDDAIEESRKWLAERAAYSKLTPAEIADPDKLESWPRPSGMLTGKDVNRVPWVTGERLAALRCLHDDSYGSNSRVVHQKDRALYLSMLQAKGLTRDQLWRARNACVFRAATLHAAVLADVGHAFGWSKDAKRCLRTAWSYLIQDWDPALEVYRIRYRKVLARRGRNARSAD